MEYFVMPLIQFYMGKNTQGNSVSLICHSVSLRCLKIWPTLVCCHQYLLSSVFPSFRPKCLVSLSVLSFHLNLSPSLSPLLHPVSSSVVHIFTTPVFAAHSFHFVQTQEPHLFLRSVLSSESLSPTQSSPFTCLVQCSSYFHHQYLLSSTSTSPRHSCLMSLSIAVSLSLFSCPLVSSVSHNF